MTDATVFRAAWVVPVTRPPIRNGWVAIRNGQILAVGAGAFDASLGGSTFDRGRTSAGPDDTAGVSVTELGDVALLPGLVNAHTHLELAWLRGRVPPAPSLPAWVLTLLRQRGLGPDDQEAMAGAVADAVGFGTAAIADIANGLGSVEALGRYRLPAVVFHEVLGFEPAQAGARVSAARERLASLSPPAHVRLRMAPHAPYSTSAELVQEVARISEGVDWPTTSIHLAESAEELQFLDSGDGPWRDLLTNLGVAPASWRAPGLSPARYLDGLGLWRPGAMAVHGVHLTERDLELLAARDVTLVTCPRSNQWVGVGPPPIERFRASGVRVAVGTDSLASAPDLNVFEELKCLRRLSPDTAARTLLSWATVNGAKALGLDRQVGCLDAGLDARILVVRVRRQVTDVEEALVSDVAPADIGWIDETANASGVRHP